MVRTRSTSWLRFVHGGRLIYASSMVLLDSARRRCRSPLGAVAARRWHRGDPRGEHCPRPGPWPCRRGSAACRGRARRLLRMLMMTSVALGCRGRDGRGRAPAARLPPIRCRCRPRSCSLMTLRGRAPSVRVSARGFMSDSRVRSGHRRTCWPRRPVADGNAVDIHGKWCPGTTRSSKTARVRKRRPQAEDPPFPRGQWSRAPAS